MLIGFFAAFTLILLSNFLLFSMYVPWRHVWGYGQGITLFVGVIALIHVEYEIGYLSRSFNSMVASIKEKNQTLTEYANELEERVAERTRDLSKKNLKLESAIRELHETQEQLLLKEKMASLGQLVAGVANEINNPVGAVNSSADASNRSIGRLQSALEESSSIEALKQSRIYQQKLKILKDNNGVILEA